MTGMEIFLIIVGVVSIVVSFAFANVLDKNDDAKVNNSGVTEAMLEEQVSKAVDHILDDRIEQTEAKMDKLSNEKIMAVGDYSENVLKEIDKNHDEVMFLYSMLNEKEKEVKNTVKDVENIKRSINVLSDVRNKEDIQINENIKDSDSKMYVDEIKVETDLKNKNLSDKINTDTYKNNYKKSTKKNIKKSNDNLQKNINVSSDNEISKTDTLSTTKKNKGVALAHDEVKKNNNNRILELYSQGKTNMEIAKELKLGMGEVRLVIDLYKNKRR